MSIASHAHAEHSSPEEEDAAIRHDFTKKAGHQERLLETDELHHVVARSRGGSNKVINLTPAEPHRHDFYHDITGNALPTEYMRVLATDAVGFKRTKTIEPKLLQTVYQIATMMDWPELYKPGSVVPSGTVESLAKHPRKLFRHATDHQVEELFHLNCATGGLENDRGYGWQKMNVMRLSCNFFNTKDNPLAAMRALLTEEYCGRFTWVDALQDETRNALLGALQDAELVELTKGANIELRAVVAQQRSYIASHLRQWTATYEKHYGQNQKKKRDNTAMRGRGGRR